jgi:CheY-like chemotaxis protein
VSAPTILLVDDDPLNLKVGAFGLKQAGFDVETARGGEEALSRARRRRPDAIVSDVMMPGMDGFTLCREIRSDPELADIPIVLVSSAHVVETDREMAVRMGANALVVRTRNLAGAVAAVGAALTRQLLALGRRPVLQPRVLDLNAVVAEVEAMIRRLISEDIQIVVTPEPRLARVRADVGQVEQVVLNLAINARDAMASGGRLAVTTRNADLDASYVRTHPEARAGRHAVIEVSDTGHGMEGKGAELRLATVYGIVRQSGGTMDVCSEPGRGTTFKAYLPAVDAEATAVSSAPAGGTETILLVEDAEPLRSLVRELLEEAGYKVIEAEAPDVALRLIEEEPRTLDLVLTDVVMPRMNGPEFVKRVVALYPGTRAIFMSGYSDPSVGGNPTLEPGVHFLQKPFTMDALMGAVRQALDGPPPASSGDNR